MRKSRHTKEQIMMALRQGEAGTPNEKICRKVGIAKATFFRCKKKYGGLGISELRLGPQLVHPATLSTSRFARRRPTSRVR